MKEKGRRINYAKEREKSSALGPFETALQPKAYCALEP
jgi:hypothetical protein